MDSGVALNKRRRHVQDQILGKLAEDSMFLAPARDWVRHAGI